MYLKIISLLVVLSLIQVNANCTCANGDTKCLEQCVASGQACIASCNGDLDCYNQCIQNNWPGQSQSTTSSVAMTTTYVASTTVASIMPTSVPSANSSSIISSSSSSSISNNTSQRPLSTFSPIPPTSSTAPSQSNTSNSKPFLIPAVAIGVASVTVMVQFFFLARMGTMLFH